MIRKFEGEYAFLSNFYSSPLLGRDGIIYPTAEHAYQAHKSIYPAERQRIAKLLTPGQAKKEGQDIHPLVPHWDLLKFGIMSDIVLRKFLQHPELQSLLLATGTQLLVEENNWHDNTWRICSCERCSGGLNWLGRILMIVREILFENGRKDR